MSAQDVSYARGGRTILDSVSVHIGPGETLVLYKHTASGWVPVESQTAGQKGHAAFTTAVTTGTWRVHYVGDATHRRGHSPAIAVP